MTAYKVCMAYLQAEDRCVWQKVALEQTFRGLS